MLLLQIVLMFFMSAEADVVKVMKVVQEYFNQLHNEKMGEGLIDRGFISTYTMDKTLFIECKKHKCKFNTEISQNPKRPDIYKIKVKAYYQDRGKRVEVPHRKGCYFVKDLKMQSYVGDCEGR